MGLIMKFEITQEKLEEMVLCIVHNGLDEDEAIDYANAFIEEIQDIDEVDYE